MELKVIFEQLSIEPLKENARSFIFNCPACNGVQKLYIDKGSKKGICFRHKTDDCPTPQKPLSYTLALLSGRSEKEVKALLFERHKPAGWGEWTFNGELKQNADLIPDIDLWPKRSTPERHTTSKTLVSDLPSVDIPPTFIPLQDDSALDGVRYLQSRGLDVTSLLKYDIRYASQYKRVIFPVIMQTRWVGYQGRTILPDIQPRMYNLPGPWKTRSLMFYDNLKVGGNFILAEGAVSALKFEKVGGFVATMGKMVSKDQILLIAQLKPHTIYIAFDRDAYVESDQLVQALAKLLPDTRFYYLPTPKHREDFGDCTYDECEYVLTHCTIDVTKNTLPIYEVTYEP